MKAREAAAQSLERSAIRHDQNGRCWLYRFDKNVFLAESAQDDKDWELYEADKWSDPFDDWNPG